MNDPLRAPGRRLLTAGLLVILAACGAPEDSSVPPSVDPSTGPPQAEFAAAADLLLASEAPFFGDATFHRLLETSQSPDLRPRQRFQVHLGLASHHLRRGEMDEAMRRIGEAQSLLQDNALGDRARANWLRHMAVVQLRRAEEENCLLRRQQDACIFPLQGSGVHDEPGPAELARQAYLDFLELSPGDGAAVWLINVLSMAVGDYPEGVPEYFRIPPEVFLSQDDIGRFQDIAPLLGVDTLNNCGGAVTEDLDGDGLLDIVTSTWHPHEPLAYYRNVGDGTFEDRTAMAGLDQQLGGLNLIGGDYDNDGDVDLLVLRGAWLFEHGQIRNSLLRNRGDGTFEDVTYAAGLANPPRPTQAAAWGDFDNDGHLDLYVANEKAHATDKVYFPAQLFRNRGDGTFEDIAEAAGVLNQGHGKGVTAGDFDNDGDLDLYVSNIGSNRLYRNRGDGTFDDVAGQLGVQEPVGRSFAPWFFDVDNDGWLDLFVAAYQARVSDIAADYMSAEHQGLYPRLYHNRQGTFVDVTAEYGLERVLLPMGANFGDLDGDGWLDMYLSTGDPSFETLVPNVMLRNRNGREFIDITTSSGLGHLQKGHGVAFADLDNDGDQDLYHQLGGFVPGDRYHNALFLNHGHGHRHLTVELRGTESNRQGIGARVTVRFETPSGPRTVHRAVGSVSSFGGSPMRQEIGLGEATAISSLEVGWPTSGRIQTFYDVPLDSTVRVTEVGESFEVLAPTRYDLAVVLDGTRPQGGSPSHAAPRPSP